MGTAARQRPGGGCRHLPAALSEFLPRRCGPAAARRSCSATTSRSHRRRRRPRRPRPRRQWQWSRSPGHPRSWPPCSRSCRRRSRRHHRPAELAMVVPPVAPPAGGNELTFQDCPTCIRMVRVPAGTFTMGQGARDSTALPAHRVSVRPFALGQSPVTVADWNACRSTAAADRRRAWRWRRIDTPVHNVSWDDTRSYVGLAVENAPATPTGCRARRSGSMRHAAGRSAATGGATPSAWRWPTARIAAARRTPTARFRRRSPAQPVRPLRHARRRCAVDGRTAGIPTTATHPPIGARASRSPAMKRVLRGGSFRAGLDEVQPTPAGNYDAPVRYLVNGFRVARDLD